jgi:hypothetical protein
MEENVLFHGTADLISKKETIAIPGTRGASPAVVVRRRHYWHYRGSITVVQISDYCCICL